MEYKGDINCLVTHILQDILIWAQQKKKKFLQVWNYLRASKWWQNFHFWVNYPFNSEKPFPNCEHITSVTSLQQQSTWSHFSSREKLQPSLDLMPVFSLSLSADRERRDPN